MNNQLIIKPYNKNYPKKFKTIKGKLSNMLNNCEIHHVGSTAVSGLGGKRYIDILIAIDDWKREKEIISNLKQLRYTHIHPKENERIFVSKEPDSKDYDSHLHIVIKNSVSYKEILGFRNHLQNHPKEVKKYFALKLKLANDTKYDRKKYTGEKGRFIRNILDKIDSSCYKR